MGHPLVGCRDRDKAMVATSPAEFASPSRRAERVLFMIVTGFREIVRSGLLHT